MTALELAALSVPALSLISLVVALLAKITRAGKIKRLTDLAAQSTANSTSQAFVEHERDKLVVLETARMVSTKELAVLGGAITLILFGCFIGYIYVSEGLSNFGLYLFSLVPIILGIVFLAVRYFIVGNAIKKLAALNLPVAPVAPKSPGAGKSPLQRVLQRLKFWK